MLIFMLDGDANHGVPLDAFARAEVARVLGSRTGVSDLEVVHAADTSTVVLVTLTGPPHRVVLKLAAQGSKTRTDFERTAAVVGLARAGGVPAAAVLAVDTSGRAGPWQYLLQEYVAGLPWRRVRPLLDEEEADAAHREIARAVLAIQAVHFDGFGELDRSARPAGAPLLSALRARAHRILRQRDKSAFLRLLSQHEHLFVDDLRSATLCHDDLHRDNLVFARGQRGWQLAGVLDWDKAWAGTSESDIARMSLWDNMTGPGFWQVYRAAVPPEPGKERRCAIYQLLWCLEYDDGSERHAADTADLWRRAAP